MSTGDIDTILDFPTLTKCLNYKMVVNSLVFLIFPNTIPNVFIP